MTWYEIILLIIVIAGALLLAWRFLVRFPQAARIDTASLPETKQQVVKKMILDQRLRRRLRESTAWLRKKFMLIWNVIYDLLRGLYHDLLEKERQLRDKRMRERDAVQVGVQSLQKRLQELAEAAEEFTRNENYDQAEKMYLEMVSLDPKSIAAFAGLGDLYTEQRKYQEAREVYEYLLRISQSSGYVYDKLGQVAQAQGRLQEAESQYAKSISADSQNAHYLFHLAQVYQAEEEYGKCAEKLEEALSLEPNNPKYLDALLEISIMTKDKVKAGECLRHLTEVNPENQKLPELKEQVEAL